MASWDIVEGRNANYIVVYSLGAPFSQNEGDIQNWLKQSDAVILEQGIYTYPNPKLTGEYVKRYSDASQRLFEQLEKRKAIPVFTTDVAPKDSDSYKKSIIRAGIFLGIEIDILINIEKLLTEQLTRRQLFKSVTKITLESILALHLLPLLQALVLQINGQRNGLQELARKDINLSQEYGIDLDSADIRDAINALKFEEIAKDLRHSVGKKPTILVYDFKPNHTMLQDFLKRPEEALLYLRQRNINFKVHTDEIPRVLRFDFIKGSWTLTKKEVKLHLKPDQLIVPKKTIPIKPESRRDFLRRALLRRSKPI